MKRRYRWVLRVTVFAAAAWWVGERLPAAPRIELPLPRDCISLGFTADGERHISVDFLHVDENLARFGAIRFRSTRTGAETRALFPGGELGTACRDIDITSDGRWARFGATSVDGERVIDLSTGERTLRSAGPTGVVGPPDELPFLFSTARTRVQTPLINDKRGRPVWIERNAPWIATNAGPDSPKLLPASGSWDAGAVSASGDLLLLRARPVVPIANRAGGLPPERRDYPGHDLLLWNAPENREVQRFDFSPLYVASGQMSSDGEWIAAQLIEHPMIDDEKPRIIEIVRRRDGRRTRIEGLRYMDGFIPGADRLLVSEPYDFHSDRDLHEIWSCEEDRLVAAWTDLKVKVRGIWTASHYVGPNLSTVGQSPFLLVRPRPAPMRDKEDWMERLGLGRFVPVWLLGDLRAEFLDGRTGRLGACFAFIPVDGDYWRDREYAHPAACISSPRGDLVAFFDEAASSLRVYEFPFRPAWWMRAIAGLVALLIAEMIARLFILFIRPFLPGRSSVEPSAATQKERRDISGESGKDAS
jgi:hypothetical protein